MLSEEEAVDLMGEVNKDLALKLSEYVSKERDAFYTRLEEEGHSTSAITDLKHYEQGIAFLASRINVSVPLMVELFENMARIHRELGKMMKAHGFHSDSTISEIKSNRKVQ